MKILLVGNYSGDAQESMQRFSMLLESELLKLGNEVRLAVPAPRLGALGRHSPGIRKWLGYVDKFLLFPRDLAHALKWADVVHICDHSNAMYTRYLRSMPHIVTCHDMMAIRSALGEIPINPTRWSGRRLQRMILAGLERAQRIACVSATTRADVLRIAKLPEARVSVIPNGLNYPFLPMERADAERHVSELGLDAARPFIIHVGGNQWYKNRMGVLRIFAMLRHQGIDATLVSVGKPWTPPMERFAIEQDLDRHVTQLTSVSNENLRALYSLAHVLLFPSLSEGFGWPIIEAQACGCPVVTSHRRPMTDVAGSAALFIDPEDTGSAAHLIASQWQKLHQLRDRGLENAARYDTDSMVEAYLREYRAAVAGSGRG